MMTANKGKRMWRLIAGIGLLMLLLAGCQAAGGETAARLIERQRAVCAGWLVDKGGVAGAPFAQAVTAYRRAHVRAIGAWLDGLEG